MVDGREFYAALRRDGGGHEGVSRGYIESPDGCISIKKYYVHLNCYRPIKKHPYTKEWFDTKKCTSASHKVAFEVWLKSKQGSVKSADEDKPKKAATKKKTDYEDKDLNTRKKVTRKKIAKKV